MHREFKALLPYATGASEFAIALFVDIRGFSAFSQETESPDTAMYVKRVYARLINEYFPTASFYKPTGDGLMVIVPYSESSLEEVSAVTIRAAMAAVQTFSSICKDDPMINFSVPQCLGVGIARGTACRISSKNKVLDYSGRLLNLAARLTNLARPEGVVIDGDFRVSMIPQPEQKRFREESIYLRGISEAIPRKTYMLDSVTHIPKENLAPLDQPIWKTIEIVKSLKDFKTVAPMYKVELPPYSDPDTLIVTLVHPLNKNGKRVRALMTSHSLKKSKDYECETVAGQSSVRLKISAILERLKLQASLKQSDNIVITVAYHT